MVVDTPVIVLALSLHFLVLGVYAFLFLFCPRALATLINVTVRQVDLSSLFLHELFFVQFWHAKLFICWHVFCFSIGQPNS